MHVNPGIKFFTFSNLSISLAYIGAILIIAYRIHLKHHNPKMSTTFTDTVIGFHCASIVFLMVYSSMFYMNIPEFVFVLLGTFLCYFIVLLLTVILAIITKRENVNVTKRAKWLLILSVCTLVSSIATQLGFLTIG